MTTQNYDDDRDPVEPVDARAAAERHLGRAGRATSADARAATGTGYAILALADALQAVVEAVRGLAGGSQSDYALVPSQPMHYGESSMGGLTLTACDLPAVDGVLRTLDPHRVTCQACRSWLTHGGRL